MLIRLAPPNGRWRELPGAVTKKGVAHLFLEWIRDIIYTTSPFLWIWGMWKGSVAELTICRGPMDLITPDAARKALWKRIGHHNRRRVFEILQERNPFARLRASRGTTQQQDVDSYP